MSLRTLLLSLAAFVLIVVFCVGTVFFQRGLSQYSQQTAGAAVQVRGSALADFLSRTLAEEWARVAGFATSIDPTLSAQDLEPLIEGYREDGDKISWAGIARTDGTVVAASEGMLVGESVAQRPWFVSGLEGPFAGDVHEAVLLADLIAPQSDTPPRFIDFSLPLRNSAGQVRGVFGVHLNWMWLERLISEMATSLNADAFLVDRTGTILISTDPELDVDRLSALASFRAANLVNSGTYVEQWPDGSLYFSFIAPDVGFADVPRFGWSLVLRLDPSAILGAQADFARLMLFAGGLMILACILALALLHSVLLRPLTNLIDALGRVSRKEDVGFVPGSSAYREASTLTDALARLQTTDADRRSTKR